MLMELWFLFCAHCLMALYIWTKWKCLEGFGSYWADMISIVEFAKRQNFVKSVDGVMVLVLWTSFDDALYLYQCLLKYLKGFQSYCANTISIVKFSKGHNSVQKKVGGVKVLILCTSSDDAYIWTKFHE